MASAVTSATEKTRLGLQQVGKMSFAQLTELLNCSMNRGLPSCLAAEDPSTNYHGKGCDIAAAAYTSELGFLANPVSTHVQPAEMANQGESDLLLSIIDAQKLTLNSFFSYQLSRAHLRSQDFRSQRRPQSPPRYPPLLRSSSYRLTSDGVLVQGDPQPRDRRFAQATLRFLPLFRI